MPVNMTGLSTRVISVGEGGNHVFVAFVNHDTNDAQKYGRALKYQHLPGNFRYLAMDALEKEHVHPNCLTAIGAVKSYMDFISGVIFYKNPCLPANPPLKDDA